MNMVFNEKYTEAVGRVYLSYTFDNTLAGSAAGKITLFSQSAGEFSVYWGREGDLLTINCNQKVLSYSPLHTFVFTQGDTNQEKRILGFTAIPVYANCLVLTDQNKNPLLTVDIPQDKLLPECLPRYSFGVIADIHYNYFFNHDKTVDYAVFAIDKALEFYKNAGCAHVCAAGDYGIYSEEKSYQDFARAIEKGGITVIACGGNHELYAKIPVMYGENGYWRTYMNKGVYDKTLEGVIDIAPNGIDFTYSVKDNPSEVFLFLSQWYWDGHTSKQPMLLEPAQLAWLEVQLERYADKTVFLLFHTYLSDDDGENVDGEGDLRSTGGYSYNGHYNVHTPDEKKLRQLLTKYKNVIWFNGHSHYEYSMQTYNENLNIFDYEGTTATMIHVPSVTNPRTVKPDATTYNSLRGKSSQGALQFVYDGFQIMNGMEIWKDEILSYACYIIYTDKKDVVYREDLNESVSWTFDRQLSSLRVMGDGAIPEFASGNEPWSTFACETDRLYTGKGIQGIGNGAFSSLSDLKRAEIKDGVRYIGDKAFNAPCLTTLILPESLEVVGKEAFCRSCKISELIYDGTKEGWSEIRLGKDAFVNLPELLPRKVKISFEDDQGRRCFDLPLGSIPQYDDIPVKNHPDHNKYYVFAGWRDGENLYPPGSPLPAASKNTMYVAKFGAEGQRYISGSLAFGEIFWCLDRKESHLVLSGEGAVPDFEALEDRPWHNYGCSISKVTVKGGITDIGANAFKQLPALNTVILEEGVEVLGRDAIGYNKLLKAVYIPATLRELGRGSVYLSDNIEVVYYGGTRSMWDDFCSGITTYYNTNLTNVKNVVCQNGSL